MAAKPKVLLVLAAALCAGAACKRAPVEPAAEAAPDLAPLPPSSDLVVSPLDGATTGFTNEMQAANLRKETGELGISHITKHHEEGDSAAPGGEPRAEAPPPMSEVERKERMEQLRAMTRQFTRMRRNIDAARDKSVALKGNTAAIIPGRAAGGALEAVEDAPGRWSGLYGGAVEPGERVVEDAAAWSELWSRVSREEPPAVDFAARRVAAVFLGPRPSGGFRAGVVAVEEGKDRVVVRWKEEAPAPGSAPPEGATAPYFLVSVPKDARPLKLEKAPGPKGLK